MTYTAYIFNFIIIKDIQERCKNSRKFSGTLHMFYTDSVEENSLSFFLLEEFMDTVFLYTFKVPVYIPKQRLFSYVTTTLLKKKKQ